MFCNYTKNTFSTIFASLIYSNMPSDRGQELFHILFCLIYNTLALVFFITLIKLLENTKLRLKMVDAWQTISRYSSTHLTSFRKSQI